MKRDRVNTTMIILVLVGIILNAFIFLYTYQNKEAITNSIQKSVQQELARYNLDEFKNIPIDDSKILLAVARYCESHNNCAGFQGPQGVQGLQGIQGLLGPVGLTGASGYSPIKGIDYTDGQDGYTPVKGVDYFDGVDGASGQDGRKIIQRCNAEKERIEWQYEGDENWTPLYNLSPLQTCAGESKR